MLTVIATDVFVQDLEEWLLENVDDGWGNMYVYWEESDKLEIICELTELAIKNLKYENLELNVNGKYKRSGYYPMELKPEHFSIEVYNPFTNDYQKFELASN